MKLLRLHLLDGDLLGILQGFEREFAPQAGGATEPLCFVGENGTGKSRLLQCIAEIFCWVDARTRIFRNEPKAEIGFRFEITYEMFFATGPRRIVIRNMDDRQHCHVATLNEDDDESAINESAQIRDLLPLFIVGYTSGENETLSVPFLDVRAEYSAEVRERALFRKQERQDIPDLRLMMMDYQSNLSILVSNFLLQPPDRLKLVEGFIRASGVDSFRMIIQLKHPAVAKEVMVKIEERDGSIRQEVRTGVQLVPQLEEYIDQLKRCATCWQYEPDEERWTLDYIVLEATRESFKSAFGTAYDLCKAFVRLSMLNELVVPTKHRERINRIRRDQKIAIKPPSPAEDDKVFRFESVRLQRSASDNSLDYISISDGEHQFIHIFGTLLMFDQPNVLFLLDEPESHFNPHWRTKFASLISSILKDQHHCLILTSHAPFVVSDSKAANVYIFRRDDDSHITAETPNFETYGASFDRLIEDVFGLRPPISGKALDELRALQETGTSAEIEKRLADFGDSSVKFYLYQRLEEQKKRS